MKRIFLPSSSGSDWQRLLAKPTLHWKKGYSAMSAAACWEAAGDKLPPEISQALDSSGIEHIQKLKLLAAIPEWETPLPGGSRPSYTDVLAVAQNKHGLSVIAVEAKVDEDFGPTLAEKLSGAVSPGQYERIKYLELLLDIATMEREVSGKRQVRYQLLHRTVSAILAGRDFHATTAIMLVHSFGQRPELRADFDRFCDVMGADAPGGNVREVPRLQGPRLVLAWVDGDKKFAEQEVPWDAAFEMERGLGDPQETVRLLNELEALGFDDDSFALLHHFRLKDRFPTIQEHRRYCQGLKQRFEPGGTNEQVQRRLKMVLAAYRQGGFRTGQPEVFRMLAEAAWAEIPYQVHISGKLVH